MACARARVCLQIKLLKLLRLLAAGDKAASDNCAAVVSSALRRAASGGNHTIGHAIVYEAVRLVDYTTPRTGSAGLAPHPELAAQGCWRVLLR